MLFVFVKVSINALMHACAGDGINECYFCTIECNIILVRTVMNALMKYYL